MLRFLSSALVVERVKKAVRELGRLDFVFFADGSALICSVKRVADDAPFRSGEGKGMELTFVLFDNEDRCDWSCRVSPSESSAKAIVDLSSLAVRWEGS
jgi:hypothetical protein